MNCLPFKDYVAFDFGNFSVLSLCGVIWNTKIVFSTSGCPWDANGEGWKDTSISNMFA